MSKRKRPFDLNEPLRHPDHRKPLTRRELISQGFAAGMGSLVGVSALSMIANTPAYAALAPDLEQYRGPCKLNTGTGRKIPFICIDLAGGANISGSNVLVGGPGGQLDFLSTAGYSKLGLPGDRIPMVGQNIDTQLGLAFHSDSAFLQGILDKAPGIAGNVNGAVIPARSDNDTGNNPHNPMHGLARYALAQQGVDPNVAFGSLANLIGSRSTVSGGNSMSPPVLINPEIPPTKVDRPSDVVGLVNTGDLSSVLGEQKALAVMEAIQRMSREKFSNVNTGLSNNAEVADNVNCQFVKSANIADPANGFSDIDPSQSSIIVNDNGGIFTQAEFDGDSEFRKTASVMKMVVDGYAGAGTITMGGYDYHTGDRATGEVRDLRAGRCMGACLEYAARMGVPLMLYVFSDGSVFSNGMIDESQNGQGKGVWTGDNSSTAASFFMVYDPVSQPQLLGNGDEQFVHQQLGWMRPDASVETGNGFAPANNVTALVDTLLLNYLALHGHSGEFVNLFGNRLGNNLDRYTAFAPLASISGGVIT
ncbi:MAG: general secretion pathway protein GspF [Gammaproteobacteria bacterium]|nr:general secretion pathway protein GspF [Gammaproteobacteria bacterium]MBT8150557.1 general secretion pathway protein GspF [Gammaproteobacteria bacterium]NNM12507.1 general secretion pathway protein GspF [Pseudomonadales bacterium]RZV55554.1 MAG: general secretion pathway protein GspF [Pseudomonadales bacterium]